MTVAVLSAVSDWIIFTALFVAFGSPILAQTTSRFGGAAVSFGVNKYWSFQSPQHARAMREAPRFLLLFMASYVLSLTLFTTLTWWGIWPYAAKLTADTICFFFNFMAMRLWVYWPPGLTASTAAHDEIPPASKNAPDFAKLATYADPGNSWSPRS